MAIFSGSTIDSLGQISDTSTKNYLYKLNEDLTYMFNNLTSDDNFSDAQQLIFAENEASIATLEVTVDGINASMKDVTSGYESSIRLLAGKLGLSTKTSAGGSSITLDGNQINLTTGNFTINATNFQVDAAGNANFSGTLTSPTINGATINSSIAIRCGDDFLIVADDGDTDPALTVGEVNVTRSARGSRSLYGIFLESERYSHDVKIWSDGLIECGDVVLTEDDNWCDGWSVYQLIRSMWDCMKAHSWDPGAYDPYA